MTQSFHDVLFPLRLALATSGGPVRRTDIVNLSNGRENRNQRWKDSRRSYDAGSSVRSVSDLYELLAFFEARSGQLYGFRFRDPVDFKSCGPLQQPSSADQWIATGDGATAGFPLIKVYGDGAGVSTRKIEKPVAGTVLVSVGGQDIAMSDYAVDTTTGVLTFAQGAVPAAGAEIYAGYEFDVPVRFDIDRLDINMTAFNAGQIPNVPLVEIRP